MATAAWLGEAADMLERVFVSLEGDLTERGPSDRLSGAATYLHASSGTFDAIVRVATTIRPLCAIRSSDSQKRSFSVRVLTALVDVARERRRVHRNSPPKH